VIKVFKVADIDDGWVLAAKSDYRGLGGAEFSKFELETLGAKNESPGPYSFRWRFDLSRVTPKGAPADAPYFIETVNPTYPMSAIYFKNRLFMPERFLRNEAEREEVILRVKKAVYEEDMESAKLRATVANFEAAITYEKTGPTRDQIPNDVKLAVWARDGGACVQCGAKKDLHFDHMIPVAKGGGKTVENIQILCEACNLRKSDDIVSR
jgi:hypothetical protein